MGLYKNAIEIISELTKDQCCDSDDQDLSTKFATVAFDTILADMEEIKPDELCCAAEMVTVRENTRLGLDLIEIDELAKYMMSNRIRNFKQAVENIAEACGRDVKKIAVVIDESSIRESMKETESIIKGNLLFDPDEVLRRAKVDGVVCMRKVMDMLFDGGISVVKRVK